VSHESRMNFFFSSIVLGLFVLLSCSFSVQGKYSLVANFAGTTFFDNWNFYTSGDPTHGYVDYQNEANATKKGLISSTATSVQIAADHTNVASGRGRASVRLTSKKTFNYGLFIIDLSHMPTGCGTWPAWWSVGPGWPNAGEIDIIEGVNEGTIDQMTLHTNAGCDMSGEDKSKYTGTLGNANCQGNSGCGIKAGNGTYGASLNSHQGGVFATEWTSEYIQTFYWPRSSIPADITKGDPDIMSWGKPFAYFQLGANCPATHFNNHVLVIDLTFCGDWAGQVFSAQCPGKGECSTFVKNNPTDFAEAYWDINYIKVFLDQ